MHAVPPEARQTDAGRHSLDARRRSPGRALPALLRLAVLALLWPSLLVTPAVGQTRVEQLPAPGEPAQRYELDAVVDTTGHRVQGHLRLRFRNTSERPIDALLFHLYPNAFAHADTVFMREGGSSIRGRRLGRPGHLRIDTLRVDGVALTDAIDDELVPNDHTQARVPLPDPLLPGHTAVIEATFETQLPEIVARMGFAGSFHLLGQWFPKLAKLESDGRFAGFPYHGLGEFYADFADYRVHLDVPTNTESACGGQRLSSAAGDPGRRIERYRLSPAHDIACVVYGGGVRTLLRFGAVAVEVIAPPGYERAVARQLAVVRDGLSFFGQHYGPYPYADLRVVIPPRVAHGASGMEYPGLIVTGGPWWSISLGSCDPLHDIITAHELAHQWFYGLIASDEVRHPFLDEGLTEWSTWALLQARHARDGAEDSWLAPASWLEALGAFALSSPTPSAMLEAHAYRPRELGRAVYLRSALALQRLADRHGQAQVLAALGRYARAHRFQHARPEDLFASLDAALGPGEARTFLEARLTGAVTSSLADGRPAPGTDTADARALWLSTLLFAAQGALGWLGP